MTFGYGIANVHTDTQTLLRDALALLRVIIVALWYEGIDGRRRRETIIHIKVKPC